MSTNYYWSVPDLPSVVTMPTGEEVELHLPMDDPKWHIGVCTGTRFVWAQKPNDVLRICKDRFDRSVIEDEYGTTFTGRQFLYVVVPLIWDSNSVGTRFS